MIISIYNLLVKHLLSIYGKYVFPILFLFCTTFTLTANAQTTLQGKVTDESGKPLQSVSVIVKGTSRGTTTDEGGNFTLSVSSNDQLVVSSVGFITKEIKVGDESNITVSLTSASSELSDVIVIGYGTQRRTNVTGAISTVSGKTITELPVASVQQALQGRVPGLQVTNNGSPGTEPLVRIRGISSITYASNPLYVIDGFPTGDLSTFDTR
ncbi:MAG TPA: carboxypeptidase-like regulatory domain-containing protein, partial [Parafilimonas sp.]|nr:carboxypeptidase-like regulatory domain-containing protein [Parafilimonas sp.]